MYKHIIFLVLLAMSTDLYAINWTETKGNLRYVFKNRGSKSNLSVIKLYYDGMFEELTYSEKEGKTFLLDRELGKYSMTSNKVTLFDDHQKLVKEFYVGNNGRLYKSKRETFTKKDAYVYSKANRSNFEAPYYFHPYSNVIIDNPELANNIDLVRFFKYFTKNTLNDLEKFERVYSFFQNRVIQTNSVRPVDISLEQVLFGEQRSIAGHELVKYLDASCKHMKISSTIVEGLYKEHNQIDPIKHSWLAISSLNNHYLYDPELGDAWMNVDPSNFIYTHFPLDASFQLLAEPVSYKDFLALPVLIPSKGCAPIAGFMPHSNVLEVNGMLEVLIDGVPTQIDINVISQNERMELVDYKKVISGGKTLLSIPINSVSADVHLKLNNSATIVYTVINNGKNNNIISDYYLKNGIRKRHTTSRQPSSNSKSPVIIEVKKEYTTGLEWYKVESALNDDLSHSLITKALEFYGLREIAGDEHNPTVLKFFKETGHKNIQSDEVSWCSVFISYCVKSLEGKYPTSATARSWLSYGKKVTQPKPGDIVIFWRESKNSWKGHVGIFLGFSSDKTEVITLGGNQDDAVQIINYPKNQVLGYRRVIK
jgi:uncharacterized protein (TIGR02594 family)